MVGQNNCSVIPDAVPSDAGIAGAGVRFAEPLSSTLFLRYPNDHLGAPRLGHYRRSSVGHISQLGATTINMAPVIIHKTKFKPFGDSAETSEWVLGPTDHGGNRPAEHRTCQVPLVGALPFFPHLDVGAALDGDA